MLTLADKGGMRDLKMLTLAENYDSTDKNSENTLKILVIVNIFFAFFRLIG